MLSIFITFIPAQHSDPANGLIKTTCLYIQGTALILDTLTGDYRIAGIFRGGGGKSFVDARICSDSW